MRYRWWDFTKIREVKVLLPLELPVQKKKRITPLLATKKDKEIRNLRRKVTELETSLQQQVQV